MLPGFQILVRHFYHATEPSRQGEGYSIHGAHLLLYDGRTPVFIGMRPAISILSLAFVATLYQLISNGTVLVGCILLRQLFVSLPLFLSDLISANHLHGFDIHIHLTLLLLPSTSSIPLSGHIHTVTHTHTHTHTHTEDVILLHVTNLSHSLNKGASQ